jgi:iron complex outermembrane receptor protein
MMKRSILVGGLALGVAAHAQRADDNAVTAAEDAFGATLGNETIGLYSARSVRGFSPIDAGNVRIEGLYFDRQGTLPPQLVEGSTIRVGLSAQGYPFPAPTGIVDYRLAKAGDTPVTSAIVAVGPYGATSVELGVKEPLVPGKLALAAGVQYAREEYYDGADATYVRAGFAPRWRPSDNVEIIPFWSLSRGRDEEIAPVIVTAGSYVPPRVKLRHHFGQSWSDVESRSENAGVVAKARLGSDWALAGGVFRSTYDVPRGHAELFTGTTPDGMTREIVIADPRQVATSTSGELRASRSVVEGPRLHVVSAVVRGRRVESWYGGSAAPIDLGPRPLGEARPVPPPTDLVFGERTRDVVAQSTVGLGYEARWRGVGELSLGAQHTDYDKRVEQPGLAPVRTRDKPWLVNGTASVNVAQDVALYAGYTEGLEESGVAPDDTANRNAALPAIRTKQIDGGLRWRIDDDLKLVAGVFDVQKPYFTTNDDNLYAIAGDVRHRGVELSLAGKLSPAWNLVAGAVLMRPRVEGEAVRAGRLGERPVGQSARLVRADVEYRPAALPGWSFDAALVGVGERTASRDGKAVLPGYATLDLGARWRFRIGDANATLRLQMANITDRYVWNLYGSNSYGLSNGRRFIAQLAVDLPR